MKKKFKFGLTGELVIAFILSFIAAIFVLIITFKCFNITSNKINKFLFSASYKDEVILKNYKNSTGQFIDIFIKENIKDIREIDKMESKIKEAFPYDYNGKLSLYIVNLKGEILYSNNEDTIFNVQTSKLKDTIEVKKNHGLAQIIEVKKINEDLYYVAKKDEVIIGDLAIMILSIIVCLIIFSLFIRGRLKYILSIERGINEFYASDFEEKIPLKYNNELTTLAVALNDMGGKIKENRENEKEFLLNISHDLRTPLTSILGFLKLLREKKYDSEEEKGRYVVVIEEKSLYLKKLIDEFFEFSKLKWQDVKLEKENIKLQEILRQVCDGFYPQLKENNITIAMNFTEIPLYSRVDIDKFIRALENIISNAIKYSSQNTVIEIKLLEKEYRPVIEIWNTPAELIKEAELKLFFKRFYKKDLSRHSKGAGLGLSIALEIIKHHGGHLKAELQNERLGIIVRL